MTSKLSVRVRSVTWETDTIRVYELYPMIGVLPAFTAGSHVDVYFGHGLVRSYSLLNDPAETHRYIIGVANDANSRGGSRFIHESLHAGDIVEISSPRNNFPLNENSVHTVLIAGGIGITPMLSMIHRLTLTGFSWQLHYCARSKNFAAFTKPLSQHSKVNFFFDDEHQGEFLDLKSVVHDAPSGSDFYCCGPTGLMQAFEAATAALPPERVHVEYFTPREEADRAGGFVVECVRSGKIVTIKPGQTILEGLQNIGLEVSYSCTQGICGACETRVLEGVPDHRDEILTQSERESGTTMMICCSGSKTAKLVLDI